MSRTALFIGGPWAGETRVVRAVETIVYAERGDLEWSRSPFDPIEIKKGYYVPQTLGFFGAPMVVWVHDIGMPAKEVAAQVGAAILNPLGIALLKEGVGNGD